MNPELLQKILVVGPALLFSVIAHEIAHGYAALVQGDATAKLAGRLTWNPVPHIDPIFTILVPALMLMGSGGILAGAKPVPVDPRNYRRLKRGDIIVSLAGVATNLVIAIVCTMLIVVIGVLADAVPRAAPVLGYVQAVVHFAVWLNWILIVFNLLPIPPLDGSHIMKYLLPRSIAIPYVRFGAQYGFILLIALVLLWGDGLRTLLYPAAVASEAFYGPTVDFWLPEAMAWRRW